MKITLKELARLQELPVAVVHSLEQALYQVTVRTQVGELLLVEAGGRPFRRKSLNDVREALAHLRFAHMVLRHSSAYDEMIGQPQREESNALEVRIARDPYPPLESRKLH